MQIMKNTLIAIVGLLSLTGAAFYLYLQTLPTSPPSFVQADELNQQQPETAFDCSKDSIFDYAYRVNISVESEINNKQVYQSDIHFNSQLSQTSGAIIKGVASGITIDEGEGKRPVSDIYYLTRAEADPYVLFSAYNDLGLVKQHPLKVIAQFIKAISVGNEDEAYHFSYDSLQRTYRYQYNGNEVTRAGYPTTANLLNLATLFDDYRSNWHAELGQGCVPVRVYSEERQEFTSAGHAGYIKFSIDATSIPTYTNLQGITLADDANAAHHWNVKQINSSDLANPVVSREQMWQILDDFGHTKNAAQLIKVSEYILGNISTEEFIEYLMNANISDELKRELAFALGLTSSDEAEAYIIGVINDLPMAAGDSIDLQKVRLMVSLTGNSAITADTYHALSALHNNAEESQNVQNNALINMGTAVRQLQEKDQAADPLAQQLSDTLSEQLQSRQVPASQLPAAIMAAGNAQLPGMAPLIAEKLSSSDDKVRYAAAAALGKNADNTDLLIQHLANEPSLLVAGTILGDFQRDQLDPQQMGQLQRIANNAEQDLAKLIDKTLSPIK